MGPTKRFGRSTRSLRKDVDDGRSALHARATGDAVRVGHKVVARLTSRFIRPIGWFDLIKLDDAWGGWKGLPQSGILILYGGPAQRR